MMTDGMVGERPTTNGDPYIDSVLSGIDARLDRIESAVTGHDIDARVVNAGDGTLLLRLENPPGHLEHGQRLRVRLLDSVDSERDDDQSTQDT